MEDLLLNLAIPVTVKHLSSRVGPTLFCCCYVAFSCMLLLLLLMPSPFAPTCLEISGFHCMYYVLWCSPEFPKFEKRKKTWWQKRSQIIIIRHLLIPVCSRSWREVMRGKESPVTQTYARKECVPAKWKGPSSPSDQLAVKGLYSCLLDRIFFYLRRQLRHVWFQEWFSWRILSRCSKLN